MSENILFSFRDDTISYTHTLTENPTLDTNRFRLHSHTKHEIYYFLQGNADFTIEGTTYHLKKGMLLLSASGQVHHLALKKPHIPYERIVIMFNIGLLPPELERQIISKEDSTRIFHLNEREQIWFEENCIGIEESNLGKMQLHESLYSMLCMLFTKFTTVAEFPSTAERQKNEIVNQIIRFINANLTSELSLEIIEKQLYRDKAHLNRIFKSAMGCSIWEYVIQKRVFSARQQLYNTRSVSAAFEGSGFHDYSVFYRNYVRCMGMSPTADLKAMTEREKIK